MLLKQSSIRLSEYKHSERGKETQRKYNKSQAKKEATRRQRERYPIQTKARRALNYAIEKGIIERGVCEVCGGIKAQGHHDNYNDPLKVRWLCASHHMEYHQFQRWGVQLSDTP